jgi:hypothetical protein
MLQKYEKREGLQSLKINGPNIGPLYHGGAQSFTQRTTEKFYLTSVVLLLFCC